MENNWREKLAEIIANSEGNDIETTKEEILNDEEFDTIILPTFMEFGNLVFEATKKECAKQSKLYKHCIDPENPCGENDEEPEFWVNNNGEGIAVDIDIESILNINKPNL